MSATPPRKTEGKQAATGTKLLALAAVLFAIGLVLLLSLDGTPEGIGVAFMSLASVPAVAGLALLGTAFISRRSRQDKPWA